MALTLDSGVGAGDILRDLVLQGKRHYGENRAQLAFHTAVSTLFLFVRLTEDSRSGYALDLGVNDESHNTRTKTYKVHG